MISEALLADLRALLGSRSSTSQDDLHLHGRGESYHANMPPEVVVFPENITEVAEIVKLGAAYRTAVIPFGTGTSLEGHISALTGGLSLDLSRMSRILSLSADDLDVVVEAGVTHRQLNAYLKDNGLFFPVDPGADASLGGMAATGASGTTTVRYGSMRHNVLSMTVVLADGRVIKTGSRARKSSAGYDLTRLLIGSEGTLGVICELTLKIYGIPEAISSAVCGFPSVNDAVQCVINTIQLGIPVARIELLDEVQMEATNRFSDLGYAVTPTLFFEFHGSPASVEEQAQSVGTIAKEFGGNSFEWAITQEERNRLWRARHDAYDAARAMRPGTAGFVTDVCVPISVLAECIEETRHDLGASSLLAPIVGHVGDGNFHIVFLVDPNSEEELDEARNLNERLIRRALRFGGTCTGEHGVGYGKIPYLLEEHGEAVEVMRTIKQALDPKGIMNPGKVVAIKADPSPAANQP